MERIKLNNILSVQQMMQLQEHFGHQQQMQQQQFQHSQLTHQQPFPHPHNQQQLQLQHQQHQLQLHQLQLHQQQQQQQQQQHQQPQQQTAHHQHQHHQQQPQHPQQQQPQQQLQLLKKPPKKELIDIVRCLLCKGCIIDAVTLDLCMHSFCRTCAVKYIREKHKCPECNLQIKDKRFLNRLKTDVIVQNIVYKLNSGLYENEMAQRRKFYAARPSPTPRYKSEMFGDIPPSKTIKPDDMINVCIQAIEEPIKTYLYCRADSTILVLREFIIRKFGLERPIKIYYGSSKLHFNFDTLMDVAANHNWSPESKILNLSFEEEDDKEKKVQVNSPPLTSSGQEP